MIFLNGAPNVTFVLHEWKEQLDPTIRRIPNENFRHGTKPKSYAFVDSRAMFIVAERPTHGLADAALKTTLKTTVRPHAAASVARMPGVLSLPGTLRSLPLQWPRRSGGQIDGDVLRRQ